MKSLFIFGLFGLISLNMLAQVDSITIQIRMNGNKSDENLYLSLLDDIYISSRSNNDEKKEIELIDKDSEYKYLVGLINENFNQSKTEYLLSYFDTVFLLSKTGKKDFWIRNKKEFELYDIKKKDFIRKNFVWNEIVLDYFSSENSSIFSLAEINFYINGKSYLSFQTEALFGNDLFESILLNKQSKIYNKKIKDELLNLLVNNLDQNTIEKYLFFYCNDNVIENLIKIMSKQIISTKYFRKCGNG